MKKILSSIVLIMIFLSGCSSSVPIDSIESKILYNNKYYTMYDSEERIAESFWEIENYETEKAKAHLEYIDAPSDKADIKIEVFKDDNLDMFVYYDYSLYCEESYKFPDYRKDSVIEKIILVPNGNTTVDEDKSVVINSKDDIEAIRKSLISASNIDNYKNNKSAEKPQTSDSDIRIVYKDFPGYFYYGYISTNQDGKYGIYCIDVDSKNYLYSIDNETADILDKQGYWYFQ